MHCVARGHEQEIGNERVWSARWAERDLDIQSCINIPRLSLYNYIYDMNDA